MGIKNKMYRYLKYEKGHRDIEVNCEYITVETKAAHQTELGNIIFFKNRLRENKVIH